MKTLSLICMLIMLGSFSGSIQAQCTPPAAPVVTGTVTYCQNATAAQLTATGTNLLWGNPVQGTVGGTSTLSSTTYIDGSYNNKKMNFTTASANVTIKTIDYYIPAWQSVNGLTLSVYNNAGTVIATSATTTTASGGASGVKITSTFNYNIATAGNYSIGVSSGSGNIGSDNPSFPITEASSTVNITGVSTSGARCFNNLVFAKTSSSTAPTPATTTVGTTTYYVTQTVAGCTSLPATIQVIVNSAPAISQVPVTNLISDYKMDGNANDATGNNQGTLHNSPSATADRYSKAGKAINFDGSTEYLSTANAYTNPSNFTISIWFKTNTTSGGRLIGFGTAQTGSSGQYDRHIYMANNGQIFFGVYPNTVKTINSTASYNDNNWHLATATLSSTAGMVLYVDGAQVAADGTTTSAENYTGYWRIGYDNNSGWTSQPNSFYFNGSLDEALIYDRTLNATEITTLFKSPGGAGNNGPVCAGSTLTLNATAVPGVTYSWTGPNSFTSASQNPTINYTAAYAGTYTVQVSAAGCISTAYTNVVSSGNTGQWTGNVSTNWADAGNWCNATVPTSATNVVIAAGASRMPAISSSVNCNNLTIQAGATVTTTAAGTLNIAGMLANSGTMVNGGTTNFNGSAQQTFSGTTTFNNLTINNNAGLVLPSAIVVNNNLTIAAGMLTTNNFAISVAGNWINNVSATAFSAGTTTVTFNGIAAQSIGGSFATTFTNLTIANTGNTVTLLANANIAGNLSVSSGTFNLSTFTANRTAAGGLLTVANNAVLQIGGTNTFPSNYSTNTLVLASTVEYSGTNQTVGNRAYGNLKLSSSAGAAIKTFPATALSVLGNLSAVNGTGTSVAFTAASNITVSGYVSLGTGTTFNGGGFAHTIGGNWINEGTFNGNTGTVTFNGPGSIISGTGAQNFNNITISVSQVSFSNANINLSGNLATTGSGSFTQAAGGTLLMTGAGKTISGSGISICNLTVNGSVTTPASFALTGNLAVAGSFAATAGTINMSGTSKSISGSGTKTFYLLSATGSITTSVDFSISSGINVSGSLTASAGNATFTGTSSLSGTANLFNATVNGTSLQLAAGSTLGIANALAISAGTLNTTSTMPNTVNFNGATAQNINSITYCNLVLSNNSTKTAVGNITTRYSLTISNGATFKPVSFTHSIYGNWINNGTFIPATSTISFMGSATAYITGITTFNVLSSNTSSSTTQLILNDNVTAATVNMINGIITTGADTITITGTRTGNGYIFGNIRRNHTFTTGVAYAFEGPNNTISFSAVSNVNSITVSVLKGSVTDFPYANAMSRLYNIAVPAGTYTASVRFHYEDDELNGNQENYMGLWFNDGMPIGWVPVGKTANSISANYVEQNNLSNIAGKWTCSINPSVVLWNGSVSSDWNTAANWTVYVGAGSTPPSASDVVVLGGMPFTHQPIISNPVSVKNIVFASPNPVNLSVTGAGSLNSGDILGVWTGNTAHTINAGNGNITVTGSLSLSDGTAGHYIDLNIGSGTVTTTGALAQSGGADIVFSGMGNLTIGGDFNYGNGTFTSGNGTVTYNGVANQVIAPVNYHNLIINNPAAVLSIDNTTTIGGDLSMMAGELDNNAFLTIAGDVNISTGAIIHNHDLLHVGGNWNNNGEYIGTNAKIVFNGSNTQNISASTFNNLEIDKPVGSIAHLTGDVVIDGDLEILSGTLDIKTFAFDRSLPGGTFTLADNATFIVSGNNAPMNFSAATLAPASTVIADGITPQFVIGIEFGNLVFRNGGVKTLVSPITVKGDLTIENGASFDGGSQTLTIKGNWFNYGTFVPSSSSIICTGAAKNISGNSTFYRLSIYGSYTFLNDNIINDVLIINPTGTLSGGPSIHTIMKGNLINKGILYTLGTTTFTGEVQQTMSLINAVQTVAITVNFNGSVSPQLNSTSAPQFGFLNINNTGGVYPSVGWDIMYGLTVGAGASFHLGASTHNLMGYLVNNGTITSNGIFNFIPTTPVTLDMGTDFTSTGRVVFDGTGAITLAGSPVSFRSITINNSNVSGISPSSNWVLTNNLIINNGATLHALNHTYTVGGNIVNNGTIHAGNSLFILNGTATQDVFSGSTLRNLAINKQSGIVTISTNLRISSNLSFISGKIQTGNHEVIMAASATVSGASQQSGWVSGYLNKAIQTGATTKAFEIGDDNFYAPVTIAFDNVLVGGDIIAKTEGGDHPQISSSMINTTKSVNRNWSFINDGATFTTFDATFKYPLSNVDAGVSTSLLGVNLYTGSSWLPVETGAVTDTSITATALTKFGDIGIGEICNKGTTIKYDNTTYCAGSGVATATLTGNTGGVYASSAGLFINAVTGEIALASSTPGTYHITYTISGTAECATYITGTDITITPEPYATGSYPGSPYCINAGVVYPAGSGTGGGMFSSTPGLSINASTGGIDVNASIAGTYSVTYTIAPAGGCSAYSWSSDVSIVAPGTWTGNLDTDWSNPANWLCGAIPTTTTNVTIPAGRNHYPVLTAVHQTQDINIQPGASVMVTGGTIQVSGTIANAGILDVSAGTVELNGSSTQVISAGTFTSNKVKDLVINNNVNLTATNTLTGTLSVAAGKTFATNNNLVLKSDANGTARIAALPVNGAGVATAYITGNVSVERYIPLRKAWRLLSVPVKSAGAPSINAAWQEGLTTASPNPNLYPGYGVFITGGSVANGFDQGLTTATTIKVFNNVTGNFVALPAGGTNSPITNFPGYFLYLRGDRGINLMHGNNAATTSTTLRIKGQINTGSQTTAVNGTGYTILGNPFPSAINFETITKNNVKNAFYVWDPKLAGSSGLGAYVTFCWNNSTNAYDATTAASPVSKYIPSGEAVIIESADGINPGSVTIKESDKTADGSDHTFGRTNGLNQFVRVNLFSSNADATTSLLDGVLTTYDIDNTNIVDRDDAAKLNGGNENIGIKRTGKMLAIERRAVITSNDTTFLNIYQMKAQSYKLEISMNNMSAGAGAIAFLRDSYNASNNIPLDLNGTTHIDFTISNDPASYSTGRFSIIFAAQVPLPVTFKSVRAYKQQEDVAVEWSTDNELHVKEYQVERSADGTHFEKIDAVNAKTNNGGTASYMIIDNDPFTGNNYYRIRSVDLDGRVGYSLIVKVVMENSVATPSIAVFPNPVTGNKVSVRFYNIPNGAYTLQLYNISGQLIVTQTVQLSGSQGIFELPGNISAGKYTLKLAGGEKPVITSLLKR